jgi:hypothetical protein
MFNGVFAPTRQDVQKRQATKKSGKTITKSQKAKKANIHTKKERLKPYPE